MDDKDDLLWQHTVRFDSALKGLTVDLAADEVHCARIAKAFGMISLDALSAHIVTRAATGIAPMVHVDLRLQGEVTQECGVSLEPFSHSISARLELDCIEKQRVSDEVKPVGEREFTLDDLDEPDVIENGQIDLGLYVIEALGEAYDPFARKPGVVFVEPEPESEPSPFAVLARLKRSDGEDS